MLYGAYLKESSMIIQTYFSISFSHYFMRCYQDKACLADYVVNSSHASHASIEFSLGADMLVSNNVQWSMGKKHFHRRYGATHKATCPRFAYIEYAGCYLCFNMQDLDLDLFLRQLDRDFPSAPLPFKGSSA